MILGVVTEEKNAVDVICQHKKDGEIIPLKIRFQDEDGELHAFSIKGYRKLDQTGEKEREKNSPMGGHLWQFDCKIQVLDRERRIRLFYNAFDNLWKMDLLR